MKVFAILLVSLATASSVITGEGFQSAVRLEFNTRNGSYVCGGSILPSGLAMTSAHCTNGTLSGRIYYGIPSKYANFLAPSIIRNVNLDVSLINFGSNLSAQDIRNPSWFTGTLEAGQEGTSVTLNSEDEYEYFSFKVMEDDYCRKWISNYSSSMFCTDQCVDSPGSSFMVNERLAGVASWTSCPPDGNAPGVYNRVNTLIGWVEATIGGILPN